LEKVSCHLRIRHPDVFAAASGPDPKVAAVPSFPTSLRLLLGLGVVTVMVPLTSASATPAVTLHASATATETQSLSQSTARAAVADRGWVTGTVVDGRGRPVVGALVNAIGPRQVPEVGIITDRTDRRTWTDDRGAFRVRQGRHGYLVQICEPFAAGATACKETAQGVGYLITYVGPEGVTDSWVTQTKLFQTTGPTRRLGEVTVKPQSFVHGSIRGASNQLVQLMRLNRTPAFSTQTDEQGNYRFEGLAPGRYRVAAGGNGWLPWRSKVVDLGMRQDLEVNGRLRLGATISGVLRAAGAPVAAVDVLVKQAGGDVVAATTTGQLGRYRVTGLRPGDYRVGILYHGSAYQRHGVPVTIPDATSSVRQPIDVRKGAVITIDVRNGRRPATHLDDELRNSRGIPILGQLNDGSGHVRYAGLSRGTYTFYGANDKRYATTTITVGKIKRYDVGRLGMRYPTLTLSGTTAPKAVVEAWTGNQCPPDGPVRPGSFHIIQRTDASGRYALHGLVPGTYMLGADGWPHNYAPRCVSGVTINQTMTRDLPLDVGGTAAGRLVYAATGTPVITTLSYELHYPPGNVTNPTGEHPARDKTRMATGRFGIKALSSGSVHGRLSNGANLEQITDPSYFVIFPFQDGTPYYLTSEKRVVDVGPGLDVNLGDIELVLHR
jgi:Carboxypeptidase regulatory-like domain